MKQAVFVGNSHVAALKSGYDQMGGRASFQAGFFCVPSADMAFTELVGDRLAPAQHADISEDALQLFVPEVSAKLRDIYLRGKHPAADVARQFLRTGQAAEIDLGDVSTIFYVAGVSPYDFLRLGEGVMPVSPVLRPLILERLIGRRYLLRPQIEAIRRTLPGIRHVFVGMPLRHRGLPPPTDLQRELLDHKRTQVAAMAGGYLFDEVFQPPYELLEDNGLETRKALFANGIQEARVFQGGLPGEGDLHHANGEYGRLVLERLPGATA